MSTKAQEARKQAEAVLKFFGIKPTGNVMKVAVLDRTLFW